MSDKVEIERTMASRDLEELKQAFDAWVKTKPNVPDFVLGMLMEHFKLLSTLKENQQDNELSSRNFSKNMVLNQSQSVAVMENARVDINNQRQKRKWPP